MLVSNLRWSRYFQGTKLELFSMLLSNIWVSITPSMLSGLGFPIADGEKAMQWHGILCTCLEARN